MYASQDSSISVWNGHFEGNEALDGGVVFIDEDSALAVRGGCYSGNKAQNGGGAFWKDNGGDIEVGCFLIFAMPYVYFSRVRDWGKATVPREVFLDQSSTKWFCGFCCVKLWNQVPEKERVDLKRGRPVP